MYLYRFTSGQKSVTEFPKKIPSIDYSAVLFLMYIRHHSNDSIRSHVGITMFPVFRTHVIPDFCNSSHASCFRYFWISCMLVVDCNSSPDKSSLIKSADDINDPVAIREATAL